MTRCLTCHALIPRGPRCRACARSRQAAQNEKRGGSGWANQANNARIIARDGGCVMADESCSGPLRVDHVVPLFEGGDDEDQNKRTLCLAHHHSVTPRGGG